MHAARRTQITAIANQKGGVGKTTTAINLAACLVAKGHQVLVVDLDPQGNASTSLGISRQDRDAGTYALLGGPGHAALKPRETSTPGLLLLPATPDLAGAEVELATVDKREFRLADGLARLCARYPTLDYVFLDCPPSLNLLSLNALVAADTLLIPLQSEFLALDGLSQVVSTLNHVRVSLNQSLNFDGIVLTMFDRRNNLCELVEADVRGFFGDKVYQTLIPRNIRLSEAPSHGMPVLAYDPKSAGAAAYLRLADEFSSRNPSRYPRGHSGGEGA